MTYPDDFNTPAYPAGKYVAISRFMAVSVMVLFFLIVCLCGVILWAKKSQGTSPFLISISPGGERWTLVSHENHVNQMPVYFVLQESVLNKFAHYWFTVSDNILENGAVWSGDCSRDSDECRTEDTTTCAIYCDSNDAVYGNFKKDVLPIYEDMESNDAAIWRVASVSARPVDFRAITENGGTWRLTVHVDTDGVDTVFFGFARVGFNPIEYPKTMGYYISDFNMFRMN
ncbi:MAG: hypothetical protein ACLRFM_00735 [Alphaproteobacteria bacterium]